jgi:hypothetical protein
MPPPWASGKGVTTDSSSFGPPWLRGKTGGGPPPGLGPPWMRSGKFLNSK